MKFGRYAAALAAIFLIASLAFSQDSVMILNHKEAGAHERPLVHFPHEQHMANIECIQCHHDYDKYHNNKGGEGRPCSDCHGNPGKKGLLPLTDAFHMQCKGCHELMLASGRKTGPVMCGECHVRQ
ncbi:MAG: cytochrome c3 family protein [Syntrophobacteraceae bacterium]|nr:cytochrome c family protein [Desulfobacteraceae bacterium]